MTAISLILPSQLPDYVKEQYPKFVLFLKTYYQYLEQQGNAADILINQQSYDDIDRTLTEFVPFFRQQYAAFFPDSALINPRLLVKVVKDFYLAKGSEQAFQIFFQMVYGIKTTLSYPNQHILRCSDGVFSETIVVRIAKVSGDPLRITGNEFSFLDGSGNVLETAFCESVQFFVIGPYQVYELVLKTSEVNFTYVNVANAITISSTLQDNTVVTGTLYTMVVGTNVLDGGTNFVVGDVGIVEGSGIGAKISVGSINPTTGAITDVVINDFGVGYTTNDLFVFYWTTNNLIYGFDSTTAPNDLVMNIGIQGEFIKPGSITATIGITLGKMGIYPRQFTGTSGLLSGDDCIQDGYFYQLYSYVINSNLSYDTWINSVNNNAHIAGTKVFGNVLLSNTYQVAGVDISSVYLASENLITFCTQGGVILTTEPPLPNLVTEDNLQLQTEDNRNYTEE